MQYKTFNYFTCATYYRIKGSAIYLRLWKKVIYCSDAHSQVE